VSFQKFTIKLKRKNNSTKKIKIQFSFQIYI